MMRELGNEWKVSYAIREQILSLHDENEPDLGYVEAVALNLGFSMKPLRKL